jgi:hypothetical protein
VGDEHGPNDDERYTWHDALFMAYVGAAFALGAFVAIMLAIIV